MKKIYKQLNLSALVVLCFGLLFFPGCSLFNLFKKKADSVAEIADTPAGQIIKIKSSDQLYELIANNQNVIVDFYATWCLPCKLMSKSNKVMAEQYTNVKIAEIDIDLGLDLAPAFDKLGATVEVLGVPTIYFFKDGAILGDSITEIMAPDEYEAEIKERFSL